MDTCVCTGTLRQQAAVAANRHTTGRVVYWSVASAQGAVSRSSSVSQPMACSRLAPHISAEGCKPPQKAGRSGWPKIRQRLSSASWMQRTPAGFPSGMPGIGLVMEGAVQQAPHEGRHARGAEDDMGFQADG